MSTESAHTNQYLQLTLREALQNVDEKYRFQVKGSVNYIFSRFNLRTQKRDLLFEGALNLHEITQFLPLFADEYVQMGSREYLFMVHVIYDQSYELISKFEGYNTIDEEKRYDEIRVQVLKLIDFFDSVFAVYLDEERKQKTKYRSDTDFSVLQAAYHRYENETVPELKRTYEL
jgi:hypothetical protein